MLSERFATKPIDELTEYLFPDKITSSMSDFYQYVFGDKAEVKHIVYLAPKKIDSKKKPR